MTNEIRFAFRRGLIKNGETWMKMIKDKIATAHTYNKILSKEISQRIITIFYPEFLTLQTTLNELKNKK